MVISTSVIREAHHQRLCRRLGVDDFELDYHGNVVEEERVTMTTTNDATLFGKKVSFDKTVNNPVLRWRIGTHRFSAVLPIKLNRKRWSIPFASGSYDVINEEEMFCDAMKIING